MSTQIRVILVKLEMEHHMSDRLDKKRIQNEGHVSQICSFNLKMLHFTVDSRASGKLKR